MRIAHRLGSLVALVAVALLVAAPAGHTSTRVAERDVVRLLNAVRDDHGLPPLRASAPLDRAARGHSADMGRRNYFSHVTQTTALTFVQRIQRQRPGPTRWLGETIGWGSGALGTPHGIVSAWMRSAPHRRTILDPRFHRIGLGAWRGSFSGCGGATVYTADFAG
jgi:uncharacterized protein YkwD